MKRPITLCIALAFIFAAFLVLVYNSLKTNPDPLAGWQLEFKPVNPAIEKDAQDYMQKLPADEKQYATWGYYYKDGAGQHAMVIEIDLDGKAWYHVLFYDKNNKRVNVMKYVKYHYMS